MRTPSSVWLVCVAVVLSSGCRLARDLLPRTHTTAVAPDGQTLAFVRQHLNSDPPDDHLYIARRGARPQEVMALAPDADWCRTIVWSPSSRKVGFLINDQQLAVYDPHSSELEALLILTADRAHEVRSVSLTDAGSVSYDLVARALWDIPAKGGQRLQVHAVSIALHRPAIRIVTPERMLGRRTVTMPPQRLSLRLRSADGQAASRTGWARLQARGGRQVRVPWVRDDDGRVRLPAFDPGPLAILEVGVPGRWRTAVLKNVAVTGVAVDVTLPIE
jgi:hypothetical protein